MHACIVTVPEYAIARFFAGLGLAGELGAGITLVSESLPKSARGYGTTVVASVGITGAVVAALVGKLTSWRTSYFVGGGLGLALLLLRVGVVESGMFTKVRRDAFVPRGNFLALLTSWERLRRYGALILVAVPIWYVVGVLVKFSDAIGSGLGVPTPPDPAMAILFCYAGLAVGDLASGAMSQLLQSRRRALVAFLALTVLAIVFYFLVGPISLTLFYSGCAILGFGAGYWAVFMTAASEQFGTNLRATATTTAPNFVRGATVPLTLTFAALKSTRLGVSGAALAVGVPCVVMAFVALAALEETYGKELDFLEQ